MTKWDTIQADVADAYIGVEENLAWEEAYKEEMEILKYVDEDEEELTLDWNE